MKNHLRLILSVTTPPTSQYHSSYAICSEAGEKLLHWGILKSRDMPYVTITAMMRVMWRHSELKSDKTLDFLTNNPIRERRNFAITRLENKKANEKKRKIAHHAAWIEFDQLVKDTSSTFNTATDAIDASGITDEQQLSRAARFSDRTALSRRVNGAYVEEIDDNSFDWLR